MDAGPLQATNLPTLSGIFPGGTYILLLLILQLGGERETLRIACVAQEHIQHNCPGQVQIQILTH